MENEQTLRIIFRCKRQWTIEAEKNTKYFYNLEKAKGRAKTCSVLYDERSKKTISNPTEILNLQRSFYQHLYTKDKTIKYQIKGLPHRRIDPDHQILLEQDIEMDEYLVALKQMCNGKSPGMDGLTVPFYKTFWGKIKHVVFDALKEGLKTGLLHESARRRVINLIPKQGKDTRKLKNLRPITLLNVDYKILEKALANRMKIVMNSIINTEQTGFMKGLRISTNIRKVLDLMTFADEQKLESLLMLIDFEKCFDKIEFQAIFGALDFFSFGDKFIAMIKTTYNQFQACVQNNGCFSKYFDVTCSVHQGGPNSSSLFLVCVEILAIMLRNGNLEAIMVNNSPNLINQFADDMDLAVTAKKSNLEKIFSILEEFRQNTGFTINYEKTTVYRIGSLKNSEARCYTARNLSWMVGPINVLGIQIDYSQEKTERINFDKLIIKAGSILQPWKCRSLSLFEKIMVINTLVGSLLIYPLLVLPTPSEAVINAFERMFVEFLWSGGKSKIATRILQAPKEQGGAGLIDIRAKDKALKGTWPRILQADCSAMQLANYHLDLEIKDQIWRCNLHAVDARRVVKEGFWRDVLVSWCEYHFKKESKDPHNEIMCYNSNIKVGGEVIFWKKSFYRGLVHLGQLWPNGSLMSVKQPWEQFSLDIMQLQSLLVAIPNEWRRVLKSKN